jgi:hypothetical protein
MPKSVTCQIFEMYAEDRQGKLIATLENVSTYKWAPGNGFEAWMRQCLEEEKPPKPGLYMAVGDGKISRWYLRYPEYVYSNRRVDGYTLSESTRAVGDRQVIS